MMQDGFELRKGSTRPLAAYCNACIIRSLEDVEMLDDILDASADSTIRAGFSRQSAAGLATTTVGILGTANTKLGAVAASTNTSTSTSKKVDYCVTILDRGDARIAQLVKAGVLLNHTAFEPYTKTPIGLSIETKDKARKADEDDAQAQIGVWISAQY
ncbi:uncharacterized protein B0I36DRAFT_364196 [Microdochium trichocladiopsis]|uniref:PD-(D/E)XK nuclease-like domain-containing protein n=1 Tax=Microdochium trichocladiopsis TaxID=1682393 RepID=A0A9P9BPW3_9PEZI|nr:uncharacterized protein B0I36DRAFT_364196 [Microdochium trichocladiopsis]KAH7029694.1 hypothetical protein B0I36DRAFT_364196 [Microdochium trichocladiopsis]